MSVDAKTNLSVIRAKLGNTNFTEGLKKAGEDIVDLASQLAPKESGRLSNSGEVNVIGDGVVEVSFGNGIPDDRAIAQEYGTVFMPAQPFLTPAVKNIDILAHVKDELKL